MTTTPKHTVSIYGNLLVATQNSLQMRAQYQAFNYRHSHSAIGGYNSMSCDLAVDLSTAEAIYQNFLGGRIASFVDSNQFAWEGFINRITYRPGAKAYTRSFDDMANRVRVMYQLTSSGATTGVSTVVNNTTSQALYGIKDAVYDTDINFGANVTHKDSVRTLKLAKNAYPQVSNAASSGGAIITLECLGFYWLWDWEVYYNTATTNNNADVALRVRATDTALFAPANASRIYQTGSGAGAWSAQITANAAFVLNQENTSGQTYLEQFQALLEAGDGAARWVFGITPLDLNGTSGNERYVYYRPAQTSVLLTTKALSEPGVIRDQYGRKVDPWRVQPDNIIRVTDVLAGYDMPGEDPRQTYITNLEYDAETQVVTYQGEDDTTLSGAMGLTQRYRKHGRRLKDAPIRVII